MTTLELRGVTKRYRVRGAGELLALDDVSFTLTSGETIALVGQSGSGKSTIAKIITQLERASSGDVLLDGRPVPRRGRGLRRYRQQVRMVFQDPFASLNPYHTIRHHVERPLRLDHVVPADEVDAEVLRLLDRVHLPRAMRNRYPHELSGGQRQRVGIARALALSPKLLIADEPTSALDVSVQARVLELFQELQREYGFACLFISHDLAVVEILSNRIAVMNKGDQVEVGPREQILRAPQQDYTRRLLAAVPVPNPAEQKLRREERDRLLEQAAAREAGRTAAPAAEDPDADSGSVYQAPGQV